MHRVVAAAVAIAALFGAQRSVSEEFKQMRAAFSAAAAKGDRAAYAKFLADDVTWVDRTGRVRDKAAQVEELEPVTGPTAISDERLCPGGAIVVLKRGDTARILQVWSAHPTGWQLVAFQGAPLGTVAVHADGRPSSPLPPSKGPEADRKAVEDMIDQFRDAARRGMDQATYDRIVSDQCGVTITDTGAVLTKQQVLAQQTGAPNPTAGEGTVVENSTRVYGDLAVTVRLFRRPNGVRNRQLFVHVRENGAWRRGAMLLTLTAE